MIKELIGAFIISFFCAAPGFCAEESGPAAPLTLRDCYKLALRQSELIAVDAEKIKEAEAHFLQALGTLLPQVSFSRTETRENSDVSPSSNRTFNQSFVFKQALFSGFKEFAGMSGSHLEKKQRENEKIRAEQLLFTDVSDAFYLLLEIREDLSALEAIRRALVVRVEELKERVALGKSRKSEVVSTETQVYTIEAEIESDKSQELIARELLEFLTGRPVDTITEPDIDFTLKTEQEYLAKASSRPDVQATDYAWNLDKKAISVAKSGLLPSVNLETDYYTHRSSVPVDSAWSTMLTVDVPIFEGTTTYGKIKESVAKARESGLLFKRAGRIASQDIHDAYINSQAALVQKGALAKALQSAELSYDLETQDYKLNIVNNLDVLTAIQNLHTARRSFIHVSYECKRFYWQLLVAAGEIGY